MTIDVERYVLAVANDLSAEFSGVLPRVQVKAVVVEARHDLEGQIAPEAFSEMLHELAHHRLDRLHDCG